MTARSDIHRPSAIVPADYDFVAVRTMKIEHIRDADFIRFERERLARHMDKTGGKYSNHFHGGSCHICGAHAQYLTVFHHRPSNSYICTGMDCAEKLGWGSGEGEAFRKNVKNALEYAARKAKAAAVLERDGLSRAWEIFMAKSEGREESIICDMVGKLVQYGSLSEKQTAFMRKLVSDIENRAAADPVPVSEKRITVVGTVVSRKVDEFFGTVRVIVKNEAGWKVMGTAPASVRDGATVGQKIKFDATVKPSDRDPKFGFFSRPTKAEVIAA